MWLLTAGENYSLHLPIYVCACRLWQELGPGDTFEKLKSKTSVAVDLVENNLKSVCQTKECQFAKATAGPLKSTVFCVTSWRALVNLSGKKVDIMNQKIQPSKTYKGSSFMASFLRQQCRLLLKTETLWNHVLLNEVPKFDSSDKDWIGWIASNSVWIKHLLTLSEETFLMFLKILHWM